MSPHPILARPLQKFNPAQPGTTVSFVSTCALLGHGDPFSGLPDRYVVLLLPIPPSITHIRAAYIVPWLTATVLCCIRPSVFSQSSVPDSGAFGCKIQ
jgi:hypothetical protein